MKPQDSPLQNSVKKLMQLPRHMPQKSSDFQNTRVKHNSKFVLMGGDNNAFSKIPASISDLSSLKSTQIRVGLAAQMGTQRQDMASFGKLKNQSSVSRMLKDKCQRTFSASDHYWQLK